jgi:hypothetical protein
VNQHEDEESLDHENGDSEDEDEQEQEHEPKIHEQDEDPDIVPVEDEDDRDETSDEEDANLDKSGSSDDHELVQAPIRPKSHTKKQPKDRTAVKTTVTTELTHHKAKQDRRYHSKKGIGKGGRTGGSKWKSDKRVRLGEDGWD